MLDLSNGRLLIEKDGKTRLNTNDLLLHGTQGGLPIVGFVTIFNLSGGDSNDGGPGEVNSSTVYDLGPVPAGHTQLYGSVKFSLFADGGAGQAFDRWTTIMGGSVLWIMDSEPGFAAAVGDNGSAVNQFISYSFGINAGRAEMVRRAFMSDTPGLYTALGHRIDYKLRTGNWT